MSESPQSPEQSAGSRPSEPLDRQVAGILDRVVKELSQDLEARIRQSAESLAKEMAEAGGRSEEPSMGALVEAVAEVDSQQTQSGILASLLEESCRFASRSAFLLTAEDGVRGWGGFGFGEHDKDLRDLALRPEDESWQTLRAGRGSVRLGSAGCEVLSAALGAEPASDGVLIPLVLGGRIAGAVYADRTNGGGALEVEALQLLTHSAAEAIETLAYRSRSGSPTLRFSDSGDQEGLPLWDGDSSAEAAAAAAEEAAAEAEPDTYIETTPVPVVDVPVIEEPAELEVAPEGEEEDPSTEAIPTSLVETEEVSEPGEELKVEAEGLFETAEAIEEPAEPAGSAFEVEAPAVEPPAAFEPVLEDEVAESRLEDTGSDIWALEEEEPDELAATGPMEAVRESAEVDLAELAEAGEEQATEEVEESRPAASVETAETEVEEPADTSMDQDPTISLEPGKKTVLLDLDGLGEEAAPGQAPPKEKESRYMDASEDPTLLTPRDSGIQPPATSPQPGAPTPDTFASPPSGSFAVPAPVGEGTAVGSFGDSMVQPPEDLEGPGLAFSGMSPGAVSGGDAALHEQARRLARLLVSEIKLYNEEIVEEGRRAGNIYDRLKEEIDRSRQLYEERVDPRVRSAEDYFHQELVGLLAGGDASLLGM